MALIFIFFPTNNTMALVDAALARLHRIYRPGFAYKKCGVMLMDLSPAHQRQQSLFIPVETSASHSDAEIAVLDSINAKHGRDTLAVAVAGIGRHWQARSETETPRYITCWEELPKAEAS